MKILWASNAPFVGTGYGTQTAQVIRRMAQDGHEVAVAANYGIQATSVTWEGGIPLLPNGLDAYGNDILPAHFVDFARGEPAVLITLYDVWIYKNPAFDKLPIASWVPVDHEPGPKPVMDWCARPNVRPIAMSKFGRQQLDAVGAGGYYVPHAIETSIFKPTVSRVRAGLGVPDDAFLVGINAANKGNHPPRKSWGEMFEALGVLMRARPDVYLYLHTDLDGHQGVNLRALQYAAGLDPDRVKTAPQYHYRAGAITQPMLAELYSACDVLLATSMGEGFGIPVIEAQACGVPVIVSDFTAQPELVGAGWTVPVQRYWDDAHLSYFGMPLVAEILDRLEQAYATRRDMGLREKAVAFAQQYDADKVYAESWRPVLRDLEAWITPATRQQKRAAARKGKP